MGDGFYLEAMGRYDESLEHARRGLEVDPFNLLLNTSAAAALAHLGRHDEAVGHLKADPGLQSLQSDPRFEDLLRRMNLR